MKKQASLAAAVAVMMAVSGVPALADATSTAENAPVASTPVLPGTESGVETPAGGENLEGLTWHDYAVLIDGVKYQFPMMYSDFANYGWEEDDDMTETLDPNSYGLYYFKKGDREIMTRIVNLGNNTVPANECIVAGISIEEMDWELDDGFVELPGGILRGRSTLDDIKAAYGAPSDTYEGDSSTKLTYETDIYESIELEIDKESGVLKDIEIENMKEPEGFEKGSVSEDEPEKVAAYKAPETLSEDMNAYQIQIEDKVYSLPVPVQTFIDDGWELDAEDSEESIAAQSYGWVYLQKGGQRMHVMADNFEDVAVLPQYGWITEISCGKQDLDLPATIPGGISVGMNGDEFVKLLDASGVDYEKDDSSPDFVHYEYNSSKWSQGIEVTVYLGDSDVYEQNTVLTVTVSNPDLE